MIICGMVVGRGEGHRHLDRVLRLASGWADRIIVVLDGDADADTVNAVADVAWMREHLTEPVGSVDESALRNHLLTLIEQEAEDGDLVVILDADEELRAGDGGPPLPALVAMLEDDVWDAWPVLFAHVWDPAGESVRVDGGWLPGHAVRAYRHVTGRRITRREFACSPIPEDALTGRVCPTDESPLVCLHWGYAYPHDRARKYAYYMDRDGGRYHSLWHLESIVTTPSLAPVSEVYQ